MSDNFQDSTVTDADDADVINLLRFRIRDNARRNQRSVISTIILNAVLGIGKAWRITVSETSQFEFKIHYLSHITYRIKRIKISFWILSTIA